MDATSGAAEGGIAVEQKIRERICKECGFFKPDIFLDGVGCCTISGNSHHTEDVCEAEKGMVKNHEAENGSV